MAVIDAKKLLPPSKKGGAIEKQKVLIPLKSISVKKVSAGDLKPVDKESKKSEDLSIIKSKIVQLDSLLKNSYVIDKKNAETKRKEEERKKVEKKEKNLEEKVKKNQVSTNLIPSIPGQSIFDKINRFIGFTILGYLFNQYGKLLPKLLEFGKILEPVGKFVEGFAKNLLKGVVDFVEFGYKAYDQTRDFVKQIGGEGAQKTFDEFSKNLNLILNGAIAASMLIISTAPKKPRGGKPGPGRLGGMPGGKPSSIPKNTKLASYLDRDPQTKLIEKRYGNNAARMYEARKAQGASVSRARADVVKRFDKLEGPQRGLGGGTGRGSILSRGIGKSANRTALKVLGKTGTRIARGVFGRIPIVGGLIDFAFSLAMGEKPGRAAAKAVGATVGSALGTFIPIPFAGTILGGILGDIVGGALYDTLIGGSKKPVQARAEGGTVSKPGQSTVTPSRRLKTKPRKTSPKIQPQRTQPGKDAGGKLRIEELYGKDEPGKRSALRALKKSSEDVKKMRSINGLAGAMFGAGIDMSLGQKPDKKLARSIGDVFGSVVQNAVNAELNNSFGDISKTIAMANGGVVPPTREIGRSLSIGEKIGKFISTALAISIESSATRILQNLNRELNLEGGPSGSMPDAGPGGGPLTQSQQEAFEKIRKIAEKVGSPNPSVTAAIAMLETGWLSNPNSVYFASGKTNPFGQTGKGTKGSVVGADGQEHAVYNSLEEGVKAHVDRWKSSYIGKTPQEIIESIRTGRGAGAPGMYNTNPNWTSKVLSTYQSGVYKQPSSGYKPSSPGNFNIIQYITGDPSQSSNYDLDGHGRPSNYHDHIAFATVEDKERAKAALRAAGITIGSELRPGDPGYHGKNLAIDIPGFQWGGTGAIGQKEYKGSAKVRRVLGLDASPKQKPKPKPPASPPPPGGPRQRLTRTNQWDPSQSGLKFNSKTGQWEKASLGPTSLDVASGLNVPSYERVQITTFVLQKEIVETIG